MRFIPIFLIWLVLALAALRCWRLLVGAGRSKNWAARS